MMNKSTCRLAGAFVNRDRSKGGPFPIVGFLKPNVALTIILSF